MREAIAEEPEWGAGFTFLALFLVNQQRRLRERRLRRPVPVSGKHRTTRGHTPS